MRTCLKHAIFTFLWRNNEALSLHIFLLMVKTIWKLKNHDICVPTCIFCIHRYFVHTGMNLIPMLKNNPDLFKQPPSDCFKLLHDSYSGGATPKGGSATPMSDSERANFARSQSLDESGYEISKGAAANMKFGAAPSFLRRESTPAMKIGSTSGAGGSVSGSISPRGGDEYAPSESEDMTDASLTQSQASGGATGNSSFKQPMATTAEQNFRSGSFGKQIEGGFREPMSPGTMLQTLKAQYSERFKQGSSTSSSHEEDLAATAEKYVRHDSGAYKAGSSFDVFAEQQNSAAARSTPGYENSAADVFSQESTDPRSDRQLPSLREQYAKNRSRSVDHYSKLDLNRGGGAYDHPGSSSQSSSVVATSHNGGGAYKSPQLPLDVNPANQQTSTSQSANQGAPPGDESQFKLPPPAASMGAESSALGGGLSDGSAAMFGNHHHHPRTAAMGANMYQERFMNIYRDMMSTSYPQDAPPAFT